MVHVAGLNNSRQLLNSAFAFPCSDSYSRYLRSSHYKDFLEGAKKKGSGRTFGLPKLTSAKLNIVSN